MNIDIIEQALGNFFEILMAQNQTKESWREIKMKTEHPRYHIMAEMTRLKTNSKEANQTLLRFSLHEPCVKVPDQDLFVFVFALKSNGENARSCLVRTVAYIEHVL